MSGNILAGSVIVQIMAQPNPADAVRQPRLIWPTLAGVGVAALIAAGAFLFSYKIEPPPDNARVIADEQRLSYASTPCVVFNKIDRELIANREQITDPSKPLQLFSYASEKTIADIKTDKKWTRDKACDYVTGFDQIVTVWMRLIGYRSRWTDEGQWRW
ncbi:hypothetical protein BH10PSE11_BH10PSE11_19840 [soil metagenome]